MSNYTNTLGGAAKDTANATVLGADYDTQFEAIATMSATKQDKTSAVTVAAQPNITSLGTLTELQVDDVNIDGDAITGAATVSGALTTAAQPNVTSVGTLTSFTSTGIDDNATSVSVTIDSDEKVFIGKTSVAIDTAGHELYPSGQAIHTVASDLSLTLNRKGSDGSIQQFRKANTIVGSISVDGSSTAFNTSSDYRLKTNWKPMENAVLRFKQLKPVNFEWISTGKKVDGFLAHELQEVIPDSVVGAKDAMKDEEYEVSSAQYNEDGDVTVPAVTGTREVPDMQGIDQSKIVPLLTATIQELITRIEALESN